MDTILTDFDQDFIVQKRLKQMVSHRLEYIDQLTKDIPIPPNYVSRYPNHGQKGHKGYKKFKQKFVLERFRQIHGYKYSYRDVVYKNQKTEVMVICPEHGHFFITPHSHWNRVGCPKCKIKKRKKLKKNNK